MADLLNIHEKLSNAVDALASEKGTIQQGLYQAIDVLGSYSPDDFPMELQSGFENLLAKFTSTSPASDVIGVAGALAQMSDEDADEAANIIINLKKTAGILIHTSRPIPEE